MVSPLLRILSNIKTFKKMGCSDAYVGGGASYFFKGIIDEVRLSYINRSQAWIKASKFSNFDELISYKYTDDITPPPSIDEGTLNLNEQGNGSTVVLDWSSYDETAVGDVAEYRIYVESSDFTDVTGLIPFATVKHGVLTYCASGLTEGDTYYFAIIVVDFNGNVINSVAAEAATPIDRSFPEDPGNLTVTCSETALTFTWTPSVNTDNDLAGYRVYFNNLEGVDIPADQTTYEVTGLTPATSYPFKITAFDNDENESNGVSTDAITLLSNPAGLLVDSHNKRVHLRWSAIDASQLQYLKHYAVYVSESEITSVEGLTPAITTGNVYADITGLTNGTLYYLAVTSVNKSNGENKTVTPVSATPQGFIISFYTMDNIPDNTLVDEEGNVDGALKNGPAQNPGYIGNALSFDGANDWVAIDGLKNYLITGDDLSISLWFKTSATKTNDYNNIIFAANRENKDNIFRIGTGNSGGIFHSSVSSDNEYGSGYNDNEWHHLVCVQRGTGSFSIYVDNTLVQSGTKTATPWSQAFYYSIGQEWDANPSDFFTGMLDQPQIFNYALSADEIDALYVDLQAPALIATYPLNNSSVTNITEIKIKLKDVHGIVDDSAVIDSIEVLNSQDQEVAGSISENNDLFTFTPDTTPLPDDAYFVSFTAVDMDGNSAVYNFRFYIDATAPAELAITGGTVTSGTISPRPAVNSSSLATITLTGTRADDTSVWVNSIRRQTIGSGDWSFGLTLDQGNNTLEVWLQDAAGNRSESEFVDIMVDTIAPVVNTISPANNSIINASPTSIIVAYTDTSSGLNKDNSLLTIKNSSFADIANRDDWEIAGDDQVVFTPSTSLPEDEYTVQVQLRDMLGNESSLKIYHFTVDTTPPAVPVINSPPVSNNETITVTGTKEIGANILLNGAEIIGFTEASQWQYTLTLGEGDNSFTFASRDKAGNQSADVEVTIQFEDVPPLAVTSLTVNGAGDGTTAVLNWNGYNESLHGDIASYRIYAETASFTDVTGHTPVQTVSKGTFTYTLSNLTRGAAYWFAVVAVDNKNMALNTVTPVASTLTDIVAPANPSGLTIACFETSLSFGWNAVTDSDLAGYKVYFGGDTTGLSIGNTLTFTKDSLSSATQYSFMIKSVDYDGNESSGTTINGVTLLNNPVNLATSPESGYVDLSWTPGGATTYLKNYNIYASTSNFTSVEGMTPAVKSTSTSVKVAGLTNNTTYYFAVTAVNLSNGEDKNVTTISDTPVPDSSGPVIGSVNINGQTLVNGYSVTDSATISLSASDPSGVSRVEFAIDSIIISTDYSGSPNYDAYWNIKDTTDGAHTITVTAYDTVGNSSSLSFNVTVTMALPNAPVITQPVTGTETNKVSLTVSGTADKYTDVIIYNNSSQAGGPVSVGDTGKFSITIQLTEGQNSITARSSNRAGTGPSSPAVIITLNTNIPLSPENVSAQAKASGTITLSWRAPLNTSVKGYNIYRSTESFSDVSGGTKINSSLITATAYNDLPPADGKYYYRLTLENSIGNVSALSQEVSATSDRTAPRVLNIQYTPGGEYDSGTGRIAKGTLGIEMHLSEPLMSAPFLSITPENGVPASIELTKVSDLVYTGAFIVTENTPSGTAYAVFSGRDIVGNRGTEIVSGESILLDTKGPEVTSISIEPDDPIKNDENNPVNISVTITLNEKIREGGAPELGYLLSGDGRNTIDIPAMSQVSDYVWEGNFTLPSDAGADESGETFSFIYTGMDDLNNESDTVLCSNIFQLFQGDLPPLAVPENLKGTVLSQGKAKLTWNAVEGAAGYVIYRKAPGEDTLTEYKRVEIVTQYTDQTTVDGIHLYAIASIRQEGDLESVSGMSATVTVISDSVAPGAPSGVALELVANGMKITWIAPAYTEPVTYRVYRVNAAEITSVSGMTPLIHSIPQTLVVDPSPATSGRAYGVTAIDAAGNESLPASDYINPGLLPVSTIKVVQSGTNPPVVTWSHPSQGSITGYDLFLGPEGSRTKINSVPLTVTSFTDTGYSGDERIYTLVALDGVEQSLPRSVLLPVLRANPLPLTSNPMLYRGIMNKLEYQVDNLGSSNVDKISLRVNIEGVNHVSSAINLGPQTSDRIPVIVGGYDSLPDVADTTTTILVNPRAGEEVQIIRSSHIEVADDMMLLQLSNEEFTKGATGKVSFTLKNTGDEEIEIITATGSNNSPSNHIKYSLLNGDGNVIATAKFKQTVGDRIVGISTGETVARIPAGETFTSAPMTIDVPLNAPDNLTILLDISTVYYHRGREGEVVMKGLSGTNDISLAETSYYGILDSVTPENSTGDEDIIITGKAIERATETPLSGVPLKLVITVKGFERKYDIATDIDGNFSYTFKPLAGESGIYTVRVVHPDRTDKPVHGQFTISRVSVSPSVMNVSQPYSFTKTLNVKVSTGEGTEVNNLGLVYDAADQTGGVFPQGVYLTPKAPVANLTANKSTTLGFTLWADKTAAAASKVILKVKSDESGADSWGTVTVNMSFSEANPVLQFSPSYMETGVGFDETSTESITLKNAGLGPMNNVSLSLRNADGTAAPNWLYFTSASELGSIAVGETKNVNISFSPTAAQVTEGVHSFKLRVESSNYTTTNINVYVSITQSGEGDVLFKVSDIYTGTPDTNNNIIQGLKNAKVYVQNEEVLTVTQTKTTDTYGEAYLTELPAGRYKCRITADNHQEYIGRLWVKPGITVNQEVFLEYNLVTVEWSVTETTIEDKYNIVLTAIYETNVPAAVVVASPSSINLPVMKKGDVYNGEFTLTNHGLIRADNIKFTLPPSDAYFKYEILGGMPTSIEAKERITVPYRVTCLMSPNGESGGSGGGCQRYLKCVRTDYEYTCSNGVVSRSSTTHCVIYDNGECTSVSGAPITSGGGGVWNVGTSTGGGSTSAPAPKAKSIEGVKCFPKILMRETIVEALFNPRKLLKDKLKFILHKVWCYANTLSREYNDNMIDISVKVPGGDVSIQRAYYNKAWHFEHAIRLNMYPDSLGQRLEYIDKGGVVFKLTSVDPPVFTSDTYKITTKGALEEYIRSGKWSPLCEWNEIPDFFKWEDKDGNWKNYNEHGYLTSFGDRKGVIGKLVYSQIGLIHKPTAITDKNDNQVLWLEYSSDILSTVRDVQGRSVHYSYDNLVSLKTLKTVTDLMGKTTIYEYAPPEIILNNSSGGSGSSGGGGSISIFTYNEGNLPGTITKATDAEGRVTKVEYDEYGNVESVLDENGVGYTFEYDVDEGKKTSYALMKSTSGMVKEMWYDKNGEIIRVDVNGRTVEKHTNDGRNLIITDEKGNDIKKTFDEWENLTGMIYPDGSHVSFDYDLRFNKVKKITDLRGNVVELQYDDNGNLTQKIEAKGTDSERIVTYEYNADNQLVTATILGDEDTVEAVTRITYHADGNPSTITDPEGNITQFLVYDNTGNLLEMKDPRGNTWKYEYDAMGRPISEIDPLNHKTSYEYDGANNRTAIINALLKRFEFEYDDHNNLIKSIDPYGKYIERNYNSDNLPVKVIDQEGKHSQTVYDSEGRISKTIDGAGNETTYRYDESMDTKVSCYTPVQIDYPTYTRKLYYDNMQRVIRTEDILDTNTTYSKQYSYDVAGNIIGEINEKGDSTTFEYDALNRLVKSTDALGNVVERKYDDRDNLIYLQDLNDGNTFYTYDRNDRLVKTIRPMLQETTYEYDEAGNRIAVLDTKGQKISYEYNKINKMVKVKYYEAGNHNTPVKTVDFTYDELCNTLTYNDGVTYGTYTYDDLQRKTGETVNYGSFSLSHSYTYYANGVKKSYTDPQGNTYSYNYDSNNRLSAIDIPGQGQVTYNYDPAEWNSLVKMTVPGGSSTEYTYDPIRRLNVNRISD